MSFSEKSARGGCVEIQQDACVADHRQHALPRGRSGSRATLSRYLYVAWTHRFDVPGARLAVERAANLGQASGWRVLERGLQGFLHGEILDISRHDTETDERDGDNNRGNEKKTQDRNAALATHHRLVPSWRAQRMPL